jgi:NADH pyrophosphatase NudC (nudix superfamily)
MIGCYGLVDSETGSIDLELDNELEDAQWFSRESVMDILFVSGSPLSRSTFIDLFSEYSPGLTRKVPT